MNNKAPAFKILAKDIIYRPKEPPHAFKQYALQHSQNIKDTVQQYARYLSTHITLQQIIPTLWHTRYYPWYRNLLSILLRCYLCLIVAGAIQKAFKNMHYVLYPQKQMYVFTVDGKVKNDWLRYNNYTNYTNNQNISNTKKYNYKNKTLNEILRGKIDE